ncbi:sensor histidine kinase [Candidatus Viridilinea mediisalina]|uniref:histidine kinase n=1 Tax=Candidatus Viridilinea mediisalina TaxID=2024553 RepID=A0A2A6RNI5_9CHLR|nr:ATP-binding protein [Candidatus Viridilinea mediisalina]PDW04475.1 two-component sensor histidine kinase [Candidatus Viridilinea mediisalina]
MNQLSWRLVAAQMLVVIVGVVVLAVTANIIGATIFATDLHDLLGVTNSDIEAAMLASFRSAITKALLIAGSAAALVGLLTSILLLRQILRPLNEIARNSQRIADGHYDERVAVPSSDELAIVATSFNQMAASLAQVEQQRVAMIGNVAHELRTPLTGIEGYLEGLIDGVFPPEPETFGEMQHEVRRMRRIIDDLQALSHVEAGQVSLQISAVDLSSIAQRVVNQLRPQTIASSLELSLQPASSPLIVRADPDRLAQILLNLVGNAIRYTPEGGCITVRLSAQAELAQVEVIDSGIGISATDLPLLFERFYRVDRSRARSSGGSGIGLTIARHLAWAMGGELSARSPGLGQGSTFTLTLPLEGRRDEG